MARKTSVNSPGLSGATSLRIVGLSSSGESGPTRPPVAFVGASEYSATSVANGSPARARASACSAFALASSSAATLIEVPSVFTVTSSSRSVRVAAVVNSFVCSA